MASEATAAAVRPADVGLKREMGLVGAVFSLIIYYWAQATRLRREGMLSLISRQAVPREEQTVGWRYRPRTRARAGQDQFGRPVLVRPRPAGPASPCAG